MASSRPAKSSTVFFTLLFLLLTLLIISSGVVLLARREPRESHIAVMEQRLRDMRQLKTVSRRYRSVIYVGERSFWRGSKEVLFTLDYEVSAGVDLSRGLEIQDLSDGIYRISMPAAEVFTSDAVEASIRQIIIWEQSVFNPINMSDYMPQIIAQGEANRQAAIDGGILNRAEVNAQEAIRNVLSLGDIREVVFEVRDEGGRDDG